MHLVVATKFTAINLVMNFDSGGPELAPDQEPALS